MINHGQNQLKYLGGKNYLKMYNPYYIYWDAGADMSDEWRKSTLGEDKIIYIIPNQAAQDIWKWTGPKGNPPERPDGQTGAGCYWNSQLPQGKSIQ